MTHEILNQDNARETTIYHGVITVGGSTRPVAFEWDHTTGEPISIVDSDIVKPTSVIAPKYVKAYMEALGGKAF